MSGSPDREPHPKGIEDYLRELIAQMEKQAQRADERDQQTLAYVKASLDEMKNRLLLLTAGDEPPSKRSRRANKPHSAAEPVNSSDDDDAVAPLHDLPKSRSVESNDTQASTVALSRTLVHTKHSLFTVIRRRSEPTFNFCFSAPPRRRMSAGRSKPCISYITAPP